MTTPTRKEIIDAYEALEDMHRIARKTTEKWDEEGITDFWKSLILKALPPKPQPTMADVNWVHSKHFLAEAEHPTYGNTVLIQDTGDELIQCIVNYEGNTFLFRAYSHNLTPTGRRYTLTEVQE